MTMSRHTQKRSKIPWMLLEASLPATSEINLPVIPGSPSSLLLADGIPRLRKCLCYLPFQCDHSAITCNYSEEMNALPFPA